MEKDCSSDTRVGKRQLVSRMLGRILCHTYVVISENTLQEILSNPHEFVSEVRASVCFGR